MAALLGLYAYSLGCETSPSPDETPDDSELPAAPSDGSLVDHDHWTLCPRQQTPFNDESTPETTCDPRGYGQEEGSFEVRTGYCPDLDVSQPNLQEVHEGDLLEVIFYHMTLAPVDGEAEMHAALAIGEEIVWELQVPIPSPAKPYTVTFPSPVDAPRGTPVFLHLHNHGYNSYNLQRFGLLVD